MAKLYCHRCNVKVPAKYLYMSDTLLGTIVEIYECKICGSKIVGPIVAMDESDEEDIS